MRKKIILFGASLTLAVGGFATFCVLSGVPLFTSSAKVKGSGTVSLIQGKDITKINVEGRKDNGDLNYVMTANRAKPDPDHRGLYLLDHPRAVYYLNDNQLLVTADTGTLLIDQTGGLEGKPQPRGGTLSKNICLTFGPRNSFIPSTNDIQSSQIQARLEEDVKFNYAERSIASPGAIHVRGPVSFDGYNLTATINFDDRRIEYLRIERGDKIIIKQGPGGLNLSGFGSFGSTESKPPVPPSSPVIVSSATSTIMPSVSSSPISTQPNTPVPTTSVAGGATATTKPQKPTFAATTYKVDFEQNVKGVSADRTLTSDQMSVIFQAAFHSAAAAPKTNTTPTPSAETPSTTPPPISPAATEAPPSQPSTLPPVAPLPPGKAEDLVITWTGPMEMRPATENETPLANSKDVIFQATSVAPHAVMMQDGATRTAQAGKVSYQASTQRIRLEPGDAKFVQMTDASLGKMVCQGFDYIQATGILTLAGPGQADVLDSAMKGPAKEAPAKQPADKQPLIAKWTKSFELTLATVPDPKNPKKTTQVVRRALLTGDVDLRDPTFAMRGDVIDALLISTNDPKQPQAIEHLLATGNVLVESTRAAAQDGKPAGSDSIAGQRLELTTRAAPGHAPEPDQLLVDGDVIAITHQPDKANPAKLSSQQIATPKLIVHLEPKAAGTPRSTQDALGGFGVRELQAAQGVKIDMEGYGPQPIVATADSLQADPKSGLATLLGKAGDGPDKFAQLKQGENEIAGRTIVLDQKSQSVDIPGAGEFVFQQPSNKGEAPTPVKVTWANHMNYSGKDLIANFTGPVEAKMLGKADQMSRMIADNMQVKLISDTKAPAAGDPNPAGKKTKLAQITAQGKVQAEGASFDADGKVLTRLFVRGPQLIYDDLTHSLRIPAAGEMVVEDYRPETAATRPAVKSQTNPLANGGNGSRGQTAFSWKDSLTYSGDAGQIQLKKDVRMVHVPIKPAQTGAPGILPVGHATTAPATKASEIELQCQDLIAILSTSKTGTSSPVALGMGGQSRISKVTAEGAAQVRADNDMLLADFLEYDAVNNKAIAVGRNGNAASAMRVDGPGMGSADRIEWDVSKGESGITLIQPRGVISAP